MMIQQFKRMRALLLLTLCAVLMLGCAALSEGNAPAATATPQIIPVAEETAAALLSDAAKAPELEAISIDCKNIFTEDGKAGGVELSFTGTSEKGIMFNVRSSESSELVTVYDSAEKCVLSNGCYNFTLTDDMVSDGKSYVVTAYYVPDETGASLGFVQQTADLLEKNGNAQFTIMDLQEIRIDEPAQGAMYTDATAKLTISGYAHPGAALNVELFCSEADIATLTCVADANGKWVISDGPMLSVFPQHKDMGITLHVSYADWDPKQKKSAEITFFIDSEAPVIQLNQEENVEKKISGVCEGESKIAIEMYRQAEGAAPELINSTTCDKNGKFTFKSKSGNWMEYYGENLYIQATDEAGNISEPVSIVPIIEAFIMEEIEGIAPIDAEIRFVDGAYNMTLRAEPKSDVRLSCTDKASGEAIYDKEISIGDAGEESETLSFCTAEEAEGKKGALILGKEYIINIAYSDKELSMAPAFKREFTVLGKLPEIYSDIAEGITVYDTEIRGSASEPGIAMLWLNESVLLSQVHTDENLEFVFEGLKPEIDQQYKISFVSDWKDGGALEKIGVVVDVSVFYGNVNLVSETISDGYAAYNKPLEIRGVVLSEKEFDKLRIAINGDNFTDHIDVNDRGYVEYLLGADNIAKLMEEYPEFKGKGDFKYAMRYSAELNVENYTIGEYNIRLYMPSESEEGVAAGMAPAYENAILIPDIINGEVGVSLVVDKDPKDIGKYTFVLALFALGMVACVAVTIITGRKVKFLKRAALNASYESNRTTRFKSEG